jgi:hypothetical protein
LDDIQHVVEGRREAESAQNAKYSGTIAVYFSKSVGTRTERDKRLL